MDGATCSRPYTSVIVNLPLGSVREFLLLTLFLYDTYSVDMFSQIVRYVKIVVSFSFVFPAFRISLIGEFHSLAIVRLAITKNNFIEIKR